MFIFFRRSFINRHKEGVYDYIKRVYEAPPRSTRSFGVRYAISIKSDTESDDSDVKFSLKKPVEEDKFDATAVAESMKAYLLEQIPVQSLSANTNLTFVEKLLAYIRDRGLVEPEVYKAAQIDRRLFSKIISNKDYKPCKDTVLAFIFALKLSLEEANDLLERAGFTLSHSLRRDIILEYFINEKVYNLSNINAFLYNMSEKIIGRDI